MRYVALAVGVERRSKHNQQARDKKDISDAGGQIEKEPAA